MRRPRKGSYIIEVNFARGPTPPLGLCSRMCSRPCLRKPIRYERGEPIFWLPPIISCCCLLLPVTSSTYMTVSKSRVRKDMRVRPPPPAPRQSAGLAAIRCQPFFIALVLKRGSNGRGTPHSRKQYTPWGTPQRTARGARLRRATPSSGTKANPRAGIDLYVAGRNIFQQLPFACLPKQPTDHPELDFCM